MNNKVPKATLPSSRTGHSALKVAKNNDLNGGERKEYE